jgi:hypothetical protein
MRLDYHLCLARVDLDLDRLTRYPGHLQNNLVSLANGELCERLRKAAAELPHSKLLHCNNMRNLLKSLRFSVRPSSEEGTACRAPTMD